MIWLFALARLFAGFGFAANLNSLHPVRFKTVDGWTIVGVYHPPRPGGKKGDVAVLIHGVGAGHGEWSSIEPRLWKMGLGTLAIDLRGHGESDQGPSGKRVWSQFSDHDWIAA